MSPEVGDPMSEWAYKQEAAAETPLTIDSAWVRAEKGFAPAPTVASYGGACCCGPTPPVYTSSDAGSSNYNDNWSEAAETYGGYPVYTGDANEMALWFADDLWYDDEDGFVTSTGWLSPGTVVPCTGGTSTWITPDNAKASDNAYAIYEVSNDTINGVSDTTGYLDLTNFSGLSVIEAEDTILGIEVGVANWAQVSSGGLAEGRIYFEILLWDGDVIGDSVNGPGWGIPFLDDGTYIVLGTSRWLWGASWTPAMMDATLGVRISWELLIAAATPPGEEWTRVNVDHVRIRVWFLDADGTDPETSFGGRLFGSVT